MLKLGRHLPVLLGLNAELEVGQVVAHDEHTRAALARRDVDHPHIQRARLAVGGPHDGQLALACGGGGVASARQQRRERLAVVDEVEQRRVARAEELGERLGPLCDAPVGRLPARRSRGEDDVTQLVEG
eukprot:1691870-Prymnesium_polylepis.1